MLNLYFVECPLNAGTRDAFCDDLSKRYGKCSSNGESFLNCTLPMFLTCYEWQFRGSLESPAGLIFKEPIDWQWKHCLYGHWGYPSF